MKLQSAIRFLFPPQCLACGVETHTEFALCGACWAETPFISGLVCDACGVPLPGEDADEHQPIHCDTCLEHPPPWNRGRAAMIYDGTARRLVLALKHGDRQDVVGPMAHWMAQKVDPLIDADTLVAPVPLHRRRMFRRRFNQAALLAASVARLRNLDFCPDLLLRTRPTRIQENMTRQERFENQSDAFAVPGNRAGLIQGRRVLLVDDVMTSGATLAACAATCLASDAAEVNVLVLARVASSS